MPNFTIFSGSSHTQLAKSIAKKLYGELGEITISKFACGEIYINLEESVRGQDIFIVQTCTSDVNDDYMELFLMADACRRSSATKIHLVMPHFGYARQDRRSRVRESISARMMANLIERVGVDHIITLNLHADQIQGFFDIPVDNISTRGFFANYFKNKNFNMEDVVVVSPDAGGVKAARKFADKLGCSLAMMHKHRNEHNASEVVAVIGEVKDKITILFDDIIDTGGSVCNAKEALLKNGARPDQVYLAASHPVFSNPAAERLSKAGFAEVVVTDSIPVPKEKRFKGLTVLSIDSLLANIIRHITERKSVSELHSE